MISSACAALCEWVLNIVDYHDKFKGSFKEKNRNSKLKNLSPKNRPSPLNIDPNSGINTKQDTPFLSPENSPEFAIKRKDTGNITPDLKIKLNG